MEFPIYGVEIDHVCYCKAADETFFLYEYYTNQHQTSAKIVRSTISFQIMNRTDSDPI